MQAEGFVGKDRMQAEGSICVAEKHDSICGALNRQAAVELGHRLKGAHARRRGCSPRRAPW